MDAKKLLNEIFTIGKRIDLIECELEKIQETQNKYPLSDDFLKDDLETILKISLKGLKKYRQKLYLLIECVKGENARIVLEYRFIACLSFQEIADKLYYSLRNVMRFYAAGINEVEEILNAKKVPDASENLYCK